MTGKIRKAKAKDLVKSYEPTPRELTALEAHTTLSHTLTTSPNRIVRMSPGAPRGNQNALKHGRYTAEAIANRREVAALLRTIKALARSS